MHHEHGHNHAHHHHGESKKPVEQPAQPKEAKKGFLARFRKKTLEAGLAAGLAAGVSGKAEAVELPDVPLTSSSESKDGARDVNFPGIHDTIVDHDENSSDIFRGDPRSLVSPFQGELEIERPAAGKIDITVPFMYSREFDADENAGRPLRETDNEKVEQLIRDELKLKLANKLHGWGFNKQVYKEIHPTPDYSKQGVKHIKITGFSSDEGPRSRGAATLDKTKDDPENIALAKSGRASSVAESLKRVLYESGIDIPADSEIEIVGKEAHFTEEEDAEMLAMAKYLKIKGGTPQEKIYNLVIDYNDGKVADANVKASLDKIVAAKRKVEIEIETAGNKKDVYLVPLPLLAILGAGLAYALRRRKKDGTEISKPVSGGGKEKEEEEDKIPLVEPFQSFREPKKALRRLLGKTEDSSTTDSAYPTTPNSTDLEAVIPDNPNQSYLTRLFKKAPGRQSSTLISDAARANAEKAAADMIIPDKEESKKSDVATFRMGEQVVVPGGAGESYIDSARAPKTDTNYEPVILDEETEKLGKDYKLAKEQAILAESATSPKAGEGDDLIIPDEKVEEGSLAKFINPLRVEQGLPPINKPEKGAIKKEPSISKERLAELKKLVNSDLVKGAKLPDKESYEYKQILRETLVGDLLVHTDDEETIANGIDYRALVDKYSAEDLDLTDEFDPEDYMTAELLDIWAKNDEKTGETPSPDRPVYARMHAKVLLDVMRRQRRQRRDGEQVEDVMKILKTKAKDLKKSNK